MTLGVKNLFGCVVGMEKSRWHLRAGQDPMAFARMLAEINACVAPALTVMDGVVGMEGNGPGSGDPRQIGVIVASRDAVALDRVIMEVLGVPPEKLPVLTASSELGIGNANLSNIEVLGDSVSSVRVKGFKLPEPSFPLRRLFPRGVQKLIKRALTNEPAFNHNLCTRCGTCAKICPPQVISFEKLRKADKRGYDTRLVIDRSKCIHCFCCQEVCPEGAITVRKGILIFS
jgi:ferredoxin